MPQDFSHRNLRAHSFGLQDLIGANFTGADIRGADFSGSCLVNADFSQTKAGLTPQLITRLLVFFLFLALLSGSITAYAGATFGYLFAAPDSGSLILGLLIAIVLILFGIASFRTGLGFALGLVSLIAATFIVLIFATKLPIPSIALNSTPTILPTTISSRLQPIQICKSCLPELMKRMPGFVASKVW